MSLAAGNARTSQLTCKPLQEQYRNASLSCVLQLDLSEDVVKEDKPVEATFTYSVQWRETDTPYEKRMDKYRRYQFLPQHLEASVHTLHGCKPSFVNPSPGENTVSAWTSRGSINSCLDTWRQALGLHPMAGLLLAHQPSPVDHIKHPSLIGKYPRVLFEQQNAGAWYAFRHDTAST